MIAEDVIGHRDKEGSFSDFLSDSTNEFVSNSCATVGGGSANNSQSDSGPRSGKLYKDLEDDDVSLNKPAKWAALLDNKYYLKCKKTGREIRRFKIFKICNGNSSVPGCNPNPNILDEYDIKAVCYCNCMLAVFRSVGLLILHDIVQNLNLPFYWIAKSPIKGRFTVYDSLYYDHK